MGSSAKKKHEKRKDFQKPKLKVGKARPKPTNFTDTSFKSKSIVLAQQSLTTHAPTPSSQFNHHLSLLTSRSTPQKRDSLAYLTTALKSRPSTSPLPIPLSIILPKLYPLILDGSNSVRAQLLLLLRALPAKDLEPHIPTLLLYIRTGLTHLAADIRSSATDILQWAIETCPEELVTCPGGWVKTIKCLLTALSWNEPAPSHNSKTSGWTSLPQPLTLGKPGIEGKLPIKVLYALAAFLRAGLVPPPDENQSESVQSKWPFPLRHVEAHMIPRQSNPFRRLNLFGPLRDEEGQMYEEMEERQRIFDKRFRAAVELGVQNAKKEAGEFGKAGGTVGRAVEEGMDGFEPLHNGVYDRDRRR